MLDLYNKKYDRQVLKDNIYALNLLDILKTQKLDITFIVRYILNKNYQLTLEEENINLNTILFLQPHISLYELNKAMEDYEIDDDSIDNFEIVASK